MFLFKDAVTKPNINKKKQKQIIDESELSPCEWINEFVSSSDWITFVDEVYLNDNFNLYGLSSVVEGYNSFIQFLRGHFFELPPDMSHKQALKEIEKLYTLIHARFLLTYAGVKKARKKYEKGVYGQCPRVECNRQNLLPIGLTPNYGEGKVKTYCPCCHDIYETDVDLDGALFGPYFPHFLLQASHDEMQFQPVKRSSPTFLGIPIEPDSEFGCHQNEIFKRE